MKKILVMAAVAVVAVAANAASFKWSAANLYSYGSTSEKFSGSVSLYAAGIDDALSTVTAANGAVAATTFSSDALVGGTTYDFYFVFETSGMEFTSATVSKLAQATSTVNIAFGNMTTQTQNASNWTAVPEPTSGLLMLLGMAGLALKRKRA